MVDDRKPSRSKHLLLGLSTALLLASPVFGQTPVVRRELSHDVSPPLSELAKNPPVLPPGPFEADELKLLPLPSGFKPASEPDAALQRTVAAAPTQLAPTLGLNFEGLGTGFPHYVVNVAPPDTNGAVGKTQYVQWVNLSFAVFDKATGNVLPNFPVPGKTLWQGFGGGCETDNDGDPIVTYDKLADRWVFAQFAVSNPPFLQCVAVSTTSDATGTYNRYSFPYSNFDDYPKLGVWPDAYYTTFNMFDPTTFAFLGAEPCAYDRNAMLNGNTASQVCFGPQLSFGGNPVGGLLPSDVDGLNPPPVGSPNFMLSFGVNSLNLFKFHVDFQTPANSTLSPATNIPVTPFTPFVCTSPSNPRSACVPQPPPGNTTLLETLGDRLMYRLAYRNFGDHESLVVNHSVIADPVKLNSGVRWYEIQNPSGTPTVAQQSTFAPDASFRWMGSAGMDVSGDFAVGYSVSSASVFPSIAFAARASNDPASTLQAETPLFSGAGSQTQDSFGNPLTRWGDYSAMQVDPVDDCTFWYTTEYLANSGIFNWNTRIANFKFANCGAPFLDLALGHTGNFTQNQTGATYTITITNTGAKPTDGTTVTVTDTLPTGLTATAAAGTGWTCPTQTGTTMSCNRTDALASGSSYPPMTVTVNVAATAGELVTNTANVAGGGDKDFVHNTASDPTTITQTGPDLVIAKTHSGPFIQGQTGTYTITVSNVGLSPTDGTTTVTVTDLLPAGLSFNAVSGQGWTCAQGPAVSCTRSDALASNTSYAPITLTVNVAATASGVVVNTASVSGGGDPNSETASDPTKVIPPPPVLTITKSHTGNFNQGQQGVQYTLTVTNASGGPTSGLVTVTDTLPTGLTVNSVNTFFSGWFCIVNSTVNVSCTRKDVLAVGSSYQPITLLVNVDANAPASVINTATVSGGGALSSNTASDTTTINPAPTLSVTKAHAVDPVVVGQMGTYTITVSNVGHAPTSGFVNVSDFLPFNSMTATSVSGPGWVCNAPPTSFVNCTRADALAAGSSFPPITLTVTVTGGGPSVTNTANVSGGGAFNNASTNDLTHITAPVLAITKTHTGDFTVGVPAAYAITVSNTGPIATVGTVTMQDFLPFGMTATSVTGAGWNCNSLPTTFVTCTRSDSLAIGLSYPALNVTARIDSSLATVVNTAQVTGGGDSTTRFANDTANVNAPSLAVTKTHSGNFAAGQTGIYTITVSNTGKIATVGTVTLQDFLPSGLTTVAIGGPGWSCPSTPQQFSFSCTRPDSLAPGASYPALILTVNVAGNVGATVTNSVNVSGGGAGASASASDTANVSEPTLSITKSHSGTFTFGQTGTYTINVSNAGALATSGTVTVTEFVPFGLTLNSISGTGWSCSVTPSVACTRSDTLSPGSSYPPITVTVTIGTTGKVTNTASVTGGGDGGFHNASDTTTITGVPPVLSITKTHSADFTVGQTGTYTITVGNTGTVATVGLVTVQDFLPSGLAFNSFTGTGWSCSGFSFVTCTRSDSLAAGGNYPPLLLTVNVNGGGPGVTNTAFVTGGGDPRSHFASDSTNVLAPVLAITESHSPDPFVVGSTGTYTITVDNKAGKAATTGTVNVNGFLPNGLAAASISALGWNCSTFFPTQFISCNRSDALTVGTSYPAISVTVNVTGGAPSLITTPSVSGGGDSQSHSTSDTTNITGPVLAITKSHSPDPLIVGQQGTYTFVVSNKGSGATSGTVAVSDNLPTGLTVVNGTANGWGCVGTVSVTCTRSDPLAAGSSYPPLLLTVNVGNSVATFINTATVTGGGDVQTHTANDFANATVPQLAITKSHPGDFTVGQPGTYTITVSNAGSVATTGTVTVNDNLPFELNVTSVSGTNWTCSGGFFPCTRFDSLAPGKSYDPITLTVSINNFFSTNRVTNTATVTGGGDGLTHTASDPTTIHTPALAISESHVGTFTVGQPASYTITVNNPGTIATTGSVTVTDNLPSVFTAGTASGVGWTCNNFGSINCSRQDVLAGGGNYPAITVSGTIDPSAQSPLLNQATVSGGGDPSSHTAADSASINFPDLAVTLAHTGNFFVGQTGAAYTINISNVGSIATVAGTITVVDPLPIGLAATQASGTGWTCQIFAGPQTEVDCTRPAGGLNPGSSYPPISVAANVAFSAPATLTNFVSFFGIGDSNLANDTASDPTTIAPIAIGSTSNSSVTITAGGSATYSFQVNLGTNPSPGTATFSVTGLPANSTATFAPSSLSQVGSVTMTVNTSGNGHVASLQPRGFGWFAPIYAAVLVPALGLLLMGIRNKQQRKWAWLGVSICALLLVVSFAGCGGGSGPGTPTPTPTPVPTPTPTPPPSTPPGTYTLTVTATTPNGTANTPVTLVVQ